MKLYELIYYFNNIFLNDHKLLNKKFSNDFIFIKIAYNNIIKLLNEQFSHTENITPEKINKLNITKNMQKKLINIIQKKSKISLTKIQKKEIDELTLINKLSNIDGIGSKKAEELIKLGITNINDLKKKEWNVMLTESTRILLKYRIFKKIPHKFIKLLEPKLKFNNKVKLVGGYLRKKPFSKDIDIIFIKTKKYDLDNYINYLEGQFTVIPYLRGPNKISMLLKEHKNIKYIKIDIFITNIIEKYYMILYGTGSKEFNIKLRSIARKKGYLLNQKGLFKKNTSEFIPVSSEKCIFKLLDIQYIKPENR